jgi:outer membrane beta-barrel protein
MLLNADLNPHMTRRSEKDMPMNNLPKSGSRRIARFAALVIAAAVTVVPMAAHAQRKSPLADAPAIRKRYELRASRLEVGAGIGSTINQDFYHSIFFNGKVGFHITDWLAISIYGGAAIANVETTFQSDLVNSLSTSGGQPGHPASEPTRSEAQDSMQKIKWILAPQLELVPFTGKYSLFGKLFASYDFYLFGGPGFINVAPTNANVPACAATNNNSGAQQYYCGVTGTKVGGNFGVGLHSYFTPWMALNVEFRDILAQLNPSGRDTDGSLHATTADLTWTHTFSVAANLVFYLPATPKVSP